MKTLEDNLGFLRIMSFVFGDRDYSLMIRSFIQVGLHVYGLIEKECDVTVPYCNSYD